MPSPYLTCECPGCADDMSENDFITFGLCRACARERDECDAADAKREREAGRTRKAA